MKITFNPFTGNFDYIDATASGVNVSIGANTTDVLTASGNVITSIDAGVDKLVFWDDSATKLTYLTTGSGLTISGTQISTNITTSTGDPTGGTNGDIWIKYTA